MKRKQEKGTEKLRLELPVVGFGGEVTLVRLALTRSNTKTYVKVDL